MSDAITHKLVIGVSTKTYQRVSHITELNRTSKSAVLRKLLNIGWQQMRVASAMSAGTAETQSGSGLQPASAAPQEDAHD